MEEKYDVKYTVLADYFDGLYFNKKRTDPFGYVVSPCYLINSELNEVILPIDSNGNSINPFDEEGNYLKSDIVSLLFDTKDEAIKHADCLNKLIGAKMQIYCYNHYYKKSLPFYYASLNNMMAVYSNNMKVCGELQNKIFDSCNYMMCEEIVEEKIIKKKKNPFSRRKK